MTDAAVRRVCNTRIAPLADRAKTNAQTTRFVRDTDDRVIGDGRRSNPILPDALDMTPQKNPALRQGFLKIGSPGWIRTTECLSQSQVPYRLATGL